jgi:hypothetical protein
MKMPAGRSLWAQADKNDFLALYISIYKLLFTRDKIALDVPEPEGGRD